MPKGLGTQIIAGILGLLFVIALVLIGRKIGEDLKNRIESQRKYQKRQAKITPTPLPLSELVGITPSPTQGKDNIIAAVSVEEIPKTGAESTLLTILLIPTGLYLRKKS